MTTTPSEQDVAAAKAVMEEHCLGNDDRFPHGENVEESGCTCSRHTLDMLSAAIATARAEEREACIAMVRERVERFRLSEPEGAAFLSALEHALTRRAEEESGRG